MGIWQEIWDADMNENGLIPLIKGVSDNEANDCFGHVIVDTDPKNQCPSKPIETCEVKVLTNVVIPQNKKMSYEIFKKLIDNYRLGSKKPEKSSKEEQKEIREFLEFAIKTNPIKIAREYAKDNGYISNDDEWINLLYKIWFKTYKNNSTCGFEHVFIGEQGSKKNKLGGHHFWYHYYLHDGPFSEIEEEDSIYFIKHVDVKVTEHSNKAEVITIKYIYNAKDEVNPKSVELIKSPKGGFFVGLSAEGLLAFGTVAMLDRDIRQEIPIKINGEKYKIKIFREGTHLRTFYPIIIND